MEEKIKSNFGMIWPNHVSNLTKLLIAAREAFDGDLDLFLVLAVIGDRTFSLRNVDPNLSYEDWKQRGAASPRPEKINVSSIAAFSGIPRETVRRKVAILAARGWVEPGGEDIIKATEKARNDLDRLTGASIQYLVRMFRLFEEFQRV
jgi:hypothetical protein